MPLHSPCLWFDPAWFGMWVGPCAAAYLWFDSAFGMWVCEEGGAKKVIEKVSQNSEGKVPENPVSNLATLAHLHGLEESNLTPWIPELGEEEGLMRAIDEMLDRLSFENESVASEVPQKGDVLQVHPKVSLQPTVKEEVCFLLRGPGGLRIQKVHGGAALGEWYVDLQGGSRAKSPGSKLPATSALPSPRQLIAVSHRGLKKSAERTQLREDESEKWRKMRRKRPFTTAKNRQGLCR